MAQGLIQDIRRHLKVMRLCCCHSHMMLSESNKNTSIDSILMKYQGSNKFQNNICTTSLFLNENKFIKKLS